MLTRGARLTLCLTLAFMVSCTAPGERAGDVQAAKEAIRLQLEKYTAALDAADTNLAAQVWLTSPEVSLIHPGGHQHGWEEVKAFYTFFGSTFSERKLTVHDVSIHVNADTAWVELYWHFNAKLRANDSPMQSDGRETQVYRKVGSQWLLVHVHYSGPPMTP
jgi:ketosteroid isomerase-like protein